MSLFFSCLSCDELCEADPDVIKDKNVSIIRRVLIIITMCAIGVLTFAQVIADAVWLKRISPWYITAAGFSMKVGILIIVHMAEAALTFILFGLFLILGLCCDRGECLFFWFNALSWANIVLGITVYAYGTQSYPNLGIACSKGYISCIKGNEIVYGKHPEKYKKFQEWQENLVFNDICWGIIHPALAIEIISFVVYIFFVILMTLCKCCCCCNREVENKDDQSISNDVSNNTKNSLDPNQNSEITNQNNPTDQNVFIIGTNPGH